VLAKLPQIIFAFLVMGVVLGIAALMIVVLHQDWDDVLLWILAAVMIISGLLVVTLRDIIRCGLAMIVCFMALAGIYVLMGVPLLGAAQVIIYIGAISVLILFAIMLTQTKDAPTRLVFQTQAGPASIAAVVIAIVIALAVTATNWGEYVIKDGQVSVVEVERGARLGTTILSRVLFQQFVFPFEIVSVLLLAAVIGGVFLAKREPGGPS
jgi:NADH-quinone oxidoreductase subunit J